MTTKEIYDEFGFVKLNQDKLDSEFVSKLNDAIDKMQDELYAESGSVFDEDGTGKIKQIQYLHKRGPIFETLLNRLIQPAQYLTNSMKLNVLNMQLFEKHPGISKPTRAHQDNAYFRCTPADAITFWIALDDIDEENGCLYYAPKTHLIPTRKHQRYHKHTTFRTRSGVPGLSICLHEHPEELDEPMIVKAGDILAHHCNTIHRAGRNKSDRRRRAIGIVFIPDRCKEDPRLLSYHNERLKEDIELQKIKDPTLYREVKDTYDYLFKKD